MKYYKCLFCGKNGKYRAMIVAPPNIIKRNKGYKCKYCGALSLRK